jgi:hypothetical protein
MPSPISATSRRPHIREMTHLDLTNDEDQAPATALRRIIANDRYPPSDRARSR